MRRHSCRCVWSESVWSRQLVRSRRASERAIWPGVRKRSRWMPMTMWWRRVPVLEQRVEAPARGDRGAAPRCRRSWWGASRPPSGPALPPVLPTRETSLRTRCRRRKSSAPCHSISPPRKVCSRDKVGAWSQRGNRGHLPRWRETAICVYGRFMPFVLRCRCGGALGHAKRRRYGVVSRSNAELIAERTSAVMSSLRL